MHDSLGGRVILCFTCFGMPVYRGADFSSWTNYCFVCYPSFEATMSLWYGLHTSERLARRLSDSENKAHGKVLTKSTWWARHETNKSSSLTSWNILVSPEFAQIHILKVTFPNTSKPAIFSGIILAESSLRLVTHITQLSSKFFLHATLRPASIYLFSSREERTWKQLRKKNTLDIRKGICKTLKTKLKSAGSIILWSIYTTSIAVEASEWTIHVLADAILSISAHALSLGVHFVDPS